jgi:tryptophanyl-tRNA synthetase
MSIVTDSAPVVASKNPDQSALVDLYRLVASAAEVVRMEEDFRSGGTGYGDFKKRLFDAMWEYFSPMRKRRAELAAEPGYVAEVLSRGGLRANELAAQTLARARQAVGLP